jgi:hypothetical protein
VTENANNRRWVVSNRLGDHQKPRDGAVRDAEALLYYQRQLEAELAHVRTRLATLGAGGAVGAS